LKIARLDKDLLRKSVLSLSLITYISLDWLI